MNVMSRLFTRQDVYAMLDAGILQEDEHLELINGELVKVPFEVVNPDILGPSRLADLRPRTDPLHGGTIHNLTNTLRQELALFKVMVREEKDFWLPDIRQLYLPDIAVVKPFNNLERHPEPDDTHLIVEVAYSSLSKDITDKLPNYLAAGIREVWIVDLKQKLIRVHRQDQAPFEIAFGKVFAPLAFPDVKRIWL
jgi:Putative restriction endonuclease